MADDKKLATDDHRVGDRLHGGTSIGQFECRIADDDEIVTRRERGLRHQVDDCEVDLEACLIGRTTRSLDRHGGDVDGGHPPPARCEPESVCPLATPDVQHGCRRLVGQFDFQRAVRSSAPHLLAVIGVSPIPSSGTGNRGASSFEVFLGQVDVDRHTDSRAVGCGVEDLQHRVGHVSCGVDTWSRCPTHLVGRDDGAHARDVVVDGDQIAECRGVGSKAWADHDHVGLERRAVGEIDGEGAGAVPDPDRRTVIDRHPECRQSVSFVGVGRIGMR